MFDARKLNDFELKKHRGFEASDNKRRENLKSFGDNGLELSSIPLALVLFNEHDKLRFY